MGSSPLTRGKQQAADGCHDRGRLIPAHAGKTCASEELVHEVGAHPRSRGENLSPSLTQVAGGGSSPLTRGKQALGPLGPRAGRLIPAHAGKTPGRCRPARAAGAHPRSRGENWLRDFSVDHGVGSSPLTRGKRPDYRRRHGGRRLIPAHAGKTQSEIEAIADRTAHPRSRGENRSTDNNKEDNMGSSPLTRGKPPRRRGRTPRARLIPAHAGKTIPCDAHLFNTPAHPRSRGENSGSHSVTYIM